mgnify:CR=1 FL=1
MAKVLEPPTVHHKLLPPLSHTKASHVTPIMQPMPLLAVFFVCIVVAGLAWTTETLAQETVSPETLMEQGHSSYQQGAFTRAMQYWTEAGRRYGRNGKVRDHIKAQVNLTQALYQTGQYKEAGSILIDSGTLADRIGDPLLKAIVQGRLGTVLFALGDNAQGQPVVVRTDTLGMELQTYPLAQVLFRLQALPGGRYLGWGPKPVGDSVYSALYHYDGAFHVLWSYQTLNTITAAATTTSGNTTFVLEGSLSGLDQNLVRVVRLDAQGTAVGDRDYPGADLWPGSLLAGGDSCYVFSSTTFDLFEHPEPAVVGVTADCLAGTSAAPEPPDFGLALSLLPNPATEQVAVRWGRTAPAGSTLVVYDATGRALLSHPVGGETGLDLPVGGWPAGLYVVMLRGNGWEQSVRGCLIRG